MDELNVDRAQTLDHLIRCALISPAVPSPPASPPFEAELAEAAAKRASNPSPSDPATATASPSGNSAPVTPTKKDIKAAKMQEKQDQKNARKNKKGGAMTARGSTKASKAADEGSGKKPVEKRSQSFPRTEASTKLASEDEDSESSEDEAQRPPAPAKGAASFQSIQEFIAGLPIEDFLTSIPKSRLCAYLAVALFLLFWAFMQLTFAEVQAPAPSPPAIIPIIEPIVHEAGGKGTFGGLSEVILFGYGVGISVLLCKLRGSGGASSSGTPLRLPREEVNALCDEASGEASDGFVDLEMLQSQLSTRMLELETSRQLEARARPLGPLGLAPLRAIVARAEHDHV